MIIYLPALLSALIIACACANAQDRWTAAVEIPKERIDKAIAGLISKEPVSLRQPTLLAYKLALFLATDSFETPTLGTSQTITAEFAGGEEQFERAVVTVEFMGYADDSLIGERFVVRLAYGQDDIWGVTGIERSAYCRGDHL
jgi:hypothetical protein